MRLGLTRPPRGARSCSKAWRSALDELSERLGPDMAAWRWGDLHHAHFIPAAAAFG